MRKKSRKPKLQTVEIDFDKATLKMLRKIANLSEVTLDQAISVIIAMQLVVEATPGTLIMKATCKKL